MDRSFDTFDEVDIVMMCEMSEEEEYLAEQDINSEMGYLEEKALDEAYESIDQTDILLDESDTDPIGMEAEEDIDAEQELLLDDEDGELIDLVAADEEEE